jgi:hypothetical protein
MSIRSLPARSRMFRTGLAFISLKRRNSGSGRQV